MPAKYEKCPREVHQLCAEIVKEHHKDIHAAGVSIDLLFAYAAENADGEKVGTALRHHGREASALAKRNPLINRVMGQGDVQILIDGDKWPELHEEQQAALLDHELQHFTVSKDAEGGTIVDSHGRPKIKMRQHDYEFGFFTAVAARRGASSLEVISTLQFYEQAGQIYFPFLGQQPLIEGGDSKSKKKASAK